MSCAAADLDAIDRAFLTLDGRPPCHAAPAVPLESRQATPVTLQAADCTRACDVGHPETVARATTAPEPGKPAAGQRGSSRGEELVERLLRVAAPEWERVALRLEQTRRAGTEVIAVTGARCGEGRTTVVACLARLLEDRGWRVACTREVPFALEPAAGDGDRRIVLVDAGVWFPAGPIRRAWLMRQAIGCPAVLLVRSADQPECPARGAALQALGMIVVGEVVTRVPAQVASVDRS